jgi:hypothetical protein
MAQECCAAEYGSAGDGAIDEARQPKLPPRLP